MSGLTTRPVPTRQHSTARRHHFPPNPVSLFLQTMPWRFTLLTFLAVEEPDGCFFPCQFYRFTHSSFWLYLIGYSPSGPYLVSDSVATSLSRMDNLCFTWVVCRHYNFLSLATTTMIEATSINLYNSPPHHPLPLNKNRNPMKWMYTYVCIGWNWQNN